MPPGWLRGSIYWVLLVSGWLAVSQTIIPDAQEHFLTASTRRHTHLFGGLGLKVVLTGTPMRSFCAPNQPSRVPTDERALADELLAQHNQECHTKLRLLTRHLRYKFTAYLTPTITRSKSHVRDETICDP